MESLGQVTIEVEHLDPGVVLIKTTGGTVDDRELARHLARIELAHDGFEAAQFVVGQEAAAEGLERTSHWNDIMAKAKRLIESGQVQILRNSRNAVVAHVVGDHGEYNCEFSRDDPESWSITGWQCECPWDQYAWQRTRKWKKYEGRVCSHVLAAFWHARRHAMDEDWDPSGGALPRGQKGVTPGTSPMPTPRNPDQMQLGLPDAGLQQGMMGPAALPGATPSGGPAPDGVMGPPGGDVIPPQPMLPGMEPQPYPVPGTTPGGGQSGPLAVSVPGAKIPDAFNPVQYPGGTFSKMAAFDHPMWVRSADDPYAYHAAPTSERARIEAHGLVPSTPALNPRWEGDRYIEHQAHGIYVAPTWQDAHKWATGRGRRPRESLPSDVWRIRKEDVREWNKDLLAPYMGVIHHPVRAELHKPHEDTMMYDDWKELATGELSWAKDMKERSQARDQIAKNPEWGIGLPNHVLGSQATFENGMMVRLDEEHIGQLEGKSEAHGAGQYAPIPKGEIGEVLGEDELPVLGKVVEVIFAGPCAKNGPLEPYHVRAFIPASDLTIAGWVQAPGPFIKRQT